MKKILILSSGYYPAVTYGGPTISIKNLVNLLSDKYEITVVCYSYELNSDEHLTNISRNEINKGFYGEKILYLDSEKYNYSYIRAKIMDIDEYDLIYVNSFFVFTNCKQY